VALLEIDRKLIDRCLGHAPDAWEDFVDRFLGLVLHVIRHTAKSRSMPLSKQDEEDLAAEFFLTIIRDDFALLRRFRGQSSLATYLTVVARRIVVRQLLQHHSPSPLADATGTAADLAMSAEAPPEQRISDHDEVHRLLRGLTGSEADVVRMYHLEGKSYREISAEVGMPENTIGSTLSRARAKMRQAVADSSA
jgi:RNA polymerase sigma-70 factor (ECF subfamily)